MFLIVNIVRRKECRLLTMPLYPPSHDNRTKKGYELQVHCTKKKKVYRPSHNLVKNLMQSQVLIFKDVYVKIKTKFNSIE